MSPILTTNGSRVDASQHRICRRAFGGIYLIELLTHTCTRIYVDELLNCLSVQLTSGELQFLSEQIRRIKHLAGNGNGCPHFDNSITKAIPVSPHGFARPLIRLAAYPAPKPLLILTTVMPLAQEFSMASRAAMPPNDAP